MPTKTILARTVIVSMLSAFCIACGNDARDASPVADATPVPSSTNGCAHPQSRAVQDGDVVVVDSLEDIGRFDGSVLVVEVAPGEPRVALNEDPTSGEPFPHVFTRYLVTVEQIVVWPDSVPTPAAGDEMALDVQGGTMGCFTLVVMPDPATLDPGGQYLVAAGAMVGGQLVLWDDRYAMEVVDGIITDPGPTASLPEPLQALVGQPTSALPPPSVVRSETQP